MKALWFSGGKDSMACLHLYRQELADIHVIWTNTGRNYPEALETIKKASEICPNWHEVRSDRKGQWERQGFPSDMVPIDWTAFGQIVSFPKKIKVQSYLNCCMENIMRPTWEKTIELGCKTVIRGQRKEESHKAPKGESPFTFIDPIEDWTSSQVLEFLKGRMEIPAHYALEHSSLDCFDCTAFASHHLDRTRYTKEKHPKLYAEYMGGVKKLYEAMREPMKAYERIIHA